MRCTITSLAILTILCLAPSAQGFNKAGHMVTSAFAYAQLSPEVQKRLTDILQNHPDFDAWFLQIRTEVIGLDVGLQLLMAASAWPDDIRSPNSPHRQHNHPTWHYINYPLRPPQFPMEPSIGGDLLTGIDRSVANLRDTATPLPEKAIYLSWLLHLVGDLHQPLHTVAMMGDQWPSGDKGGNDFWIRPATSPVNLHSFWDGTLGRSTDPSAAINYATRLKAEHPSDSLPELLKAKKPEDWILESRLVAIETCYVRGTLQGTKKSDDAHPLPEGYTKDAKVVAERRAALAGYRLASMIEGILSE